jgi:hypothetical protein
MFGSSDLRKRGHGVSEERAWSCVKSVFPIRFSHFIALQGYCRQVGLFE